jgi:hypothetical protein
MGLLDDAIREHLDLKRARGADPTEIERLEREALGPVRRERGVGAPQVEVHEEYGAERLTGEEPTSYHDSTTPHGDHDASAPPLSLAGAHEPQNGVHVEAEDAPPKRRGFLRRRPTPEPEPVEAHHEDPEYVEGTVLFESVHDEPLLDDEPMHDDDPLLHVEPLPHDEPLPQADVPEHADTPADLPVPQPPPLAFEAPPERPRFRPEPPTTVQPVHIDDEEPVEPPPAPSDLHEGPQAPAVEPVPPHVDQTPPPVAPAPPHAEPQPTREFDVLAETSPEDEKEEDVLEETPEFLQDTPEHDRLWFEQRPPRDFDFDG